MSDTFVSDSPAATRAWAKRLAATLPTPCVIALFGNLGAGKTVVAQGIAAGLGIELPVTSPTFILINEYELPSGSFLFHVDCYRLDDPVADAIALGLPETFDQGVVLIEWADRILPLLPPGCIEITLEDAGPGHRRISLHLPSSAMQAA